MHTALAIRPPSVCPSRSSFWRLGFSFCVRSYSSRCLSTHTEGSLCSLPKRAIAERRSHQVSRLGASHRRRNSSHCAEVVCYSAELTMGQQWGVGDESFTGNVDVLHGLHHRSVCFPSREWRSGTGQVGALRPDLRRGAETSASRRHHAHSRASGAHGQSPLPMVGADREEEVG